MKIKKINKIIKKSNLIDIGIVNNHTFWAADNKDGPWYLTHNSMPDIDCLQGNMLVKTINGYKEIRSLSIGEYVYDHHGNKKKVLSIANRGRKKGDVIYEMFFKIGECFGSGILTSKHRLLDINGEQVFVKDIVIGDILHGKNKEEIVVVRKEIYVEECNLTDITVEGSSTFQFVPYNVLEVQTDVGDLLITVDNKHSTNGLYSKVFSELYHNKLIENIKYTKYVIHSSLNKNLTVSSHNSDFSDRNMAVNIIAEHFGKENVIPVSNFNQLQLRSLIKDLCKLNGVPFDEVNKYTKNIESEALDSAKKKPGFDRQAWVMTYEVAAKNSKTFRDLMNKFPNIEENVRVLFKQMRNVSRHAGGVIITDQPEKHMPIIKSGGVLQTPWQEGLNFRHLENLGFLKFDILGLGTLRIFENTVRRILKKQGNKHPTFDQISEWFYENVHPDNNDMSDQKVYKHVYEEGHWAGIFQFVQTPVQKFVMKMKPKNIVDLATATSIFRPGPLGISADKLYLKNRADPENISYKHPMLKEVLSDTYGLIVFQEQLQLIYHKLAGVPLDETDAVRKAFTKKDMSNKAEAAKERLRLREDFANKCLSVNDIPKSISYSIFEDIEKFVAYSFNKSHAVSYTITSFQCAWLYTYYPDEWIASYIDYYATEKGQASGRESPVSVALGDAKASGYKIGKPDINYSDEDYQVLDKVLVPSFRSLKNVGIPAIEEIREYRPYKNLEDLILSPGEKWRHKKFNKKALSTLIKLEAFGSMDLVGPDKIFKNYRQMHYVLIENVDKIKRAASRKKAPRPNEVIKTLINEAIELEDWSIDEKISNSYTLSGSVDINLIITKDVREYLETSGMGSVDEWRSEHEWYWCVVKQSAVYTTRKGKPYLRMKIYGESGKEQSCFIWGYNPIRDSKIASNTLILAKFKKSDFGLSTFFSKIEAIERT